MLRQIYKFDVLTDRTMCYFYGLMIHDRRYSRIITNNHNLGTFILWDDAILIIEWDKEEVSSDIVNEGIRELSAIEELASLNE